MLVLLFYLNQMDWRTLDDRDVNTTTFKYRLNFILHYSDINRKNYGRGDKAESSRKYIYIFLVHKNISLVGITDDYKYDDDNSTIHTALKMIQVQQNHH